MSLLQLVSRCVSLRLCSSLLRKIITRFFLEKAERNPGWREETTCIMRSNGPKANMQKWTFFRVIRCWLRFVFALPWNHLIALFVKTIGHKSRSINFACLVPAPAVEVNKLFGIHISYLIYSLRFNLNAIARLGRGFLIFRVDGCQPLEFGSCLALSPRLDTSRAAIY